MVWSQEEIDAFKARRAQGDGDGNLGKVDDFVCFDQDATRRSPGGASPTKSPTARKWKPTPTLENRRSDEWLGSPTPPKRSWKVKTPASPPAIDLSK